MPRISGHLDIVQVNEPSAPSAGRQHLYFKSDGLLYSKTSDGTVTQIGSGGGGGISASIFDAKGDIIVASAADTAIRLALGSDNQVLTVDSAEAGGLKWTTPAAALVSSVNTRTGNVTGLAEDSDVVHLAGTENITGVKTLLSSSGSPRLILKNPTLATSGAPTVNSPTLRFETGRWNGSAHSDNYLYLQAHQLSSASGDNVLSVGTTSSLSNLKAKTVQAKLDYTSKEGRYLGALPTGAPGSDPTGSGLVAFQAGDFVVNDNGSIYVHNGTMFVRVDAGAIHDLANAKGDLLVANAADALGRLAVGSNDTVLIADSTQNYGVRWGAVSDASAVKLTGAQTVAGVKTFSSAPVVPDSSFTIAKTTGLQTALDAKAADSAVVKLTGAQSLAGTKTFADAPIVPDNSFTIGKTTGLQTALDAAIQKSLVDAKGDLFVGTANDTVSRLAVGTNGKVLVADSAQTSGVKWDTVTAFLDIFGDGSDGVVNFDGTSTVLGFVPSGGVYTINRDLQLADGSQISGTAVVSIPGYRIFCKGTFTIASGASVRADGMHGATATTSTSFPSSWGLGGNGANARTSASAGSTGATALASGHSAMSGSLVTGVSGSGGSAGANAGGDGSTSVAAAFILGDITTAARTGGHGGGSGALVGTVGGGAVSGQGGYGGHGLLICARILNCSGTLRSRGGNGGNAVLGLATGAGGGGGGTGGAVCIVTTSLVGSPTYDVAGGSGGTGAGTGSSGTAGQSGQTYVLLVETAQPPVPTAGTPGTAVQPLSGTSVSAGGSNDYARVDHNHGVPQNPSVATLLASGTITANGGLYDGANRAYSDSNPPETLVVTETAAAPSAPAAGFGVYYMKSSDDKPYFKNASDIEYPLTPQTDIYKVTADTALTTTTFTNIPGLSFVVANGVSYEFEAMLVFTAALATTGFRFGMNFQNGATPLAVIEYQTSATAWATFSQTATTPNMTATTATYAATPTGVLCRIKGLGLSQNATSWAIQGATEIASSAITIRKGSLLKVTTIV